MAILATAYCYCLLPTIHLGIEYQDAKQESIFGPDGRIVAVYDENGVNITNFRPEYWHTDHLGNVRLAFSDVNNNGRIEIEDDPATPEDDTEIMQENHYYPFGMNQMGPWYEVVTPENKYQYNGKELNEELGLDWYDYGARWYDGSIGRWGQVDPMAEKYFSISPFVYVGNMPTIAIDTDGKKIVIVNNSYYNQTLLDLARIYSTKMGRQIIDRLAASNTVYKIDGSATSIRGGLIWGTRYNTLTNNLTYTQKFLNVDDAYTLSHTTLAHELYHAYQDDLKVKYASKADEEADAIRFENYIRDVFGGNKNEHRIKHSGINVVKGISASDSFGERVELSSVRVQSILTGNLVNAEEEDGKNDLRRDNTRVQVNNIDVQHILEYMDRHGLQRIEIRFDQWNKRQNERK